MRGKYATKAVGRREAELAAEVERLESLVESEKALRKKQQQETKQLERDMNRRIADSTSTMITHVVQEQIDIMANGIAKTEIDTHRLVMTRHLFHMFLAGVVDWDRLRGDVEMVSFIAAHGDLAEWWRLLDEQVFKASRSRRRDRGARDPLRPLLDIERSVAVATDPTSRNAERYLAMRLELNEELSAARDEYLAGNGKYPVPAVFEFSD